MDRPGVLDVDPPGRVPAGEDSAISLLSFEELVGRFEAIRYTDATTIIELSTGSLQFPSSSRAAITCESQLEGHEDELVGILRTNSVDRPVRIRVVDPPTK